MKRLTLALILLAAPALAEDKPNLDRTALTGPGIVALYLSARALYDLGLAANDPLMVLTAARMMRGVTMTPAQRSPDGTPNDVPPRILPPVPDVMFDKARSMDAAGTFADLIEILSRETVPPPKTLQASPSLLSPAEVDTWTLPFYGGTLAEVAIVGNRTGNLDLTVSDAGGHVVCVENGAGYRAYCGFVPQDHGDFTVSVTNSGLAVDGYLLLTN